METKMQTFDTNQALMDVFYEKNFTRKICVKFFPSPTKPEYCLGCNYKSEEHHPYRDLKRWSRTAEAWRPELHLDILLCKEIRKINFVNQVENFEKRADFCILSNDTHPQTVLNVLLREWNMEKPNLVISVTGSCRYLPISTAHFQKLKSGFMRIVNPTKSWIITGGTSIGVDNIISEVMKEAQYLEWMGTDAPSFYMIGLTNWNCVDRNEEINRANIENNDIYSYLVKKTNKLQKFSRELITPLNALYSHFVFIEGGIRGKWGQEIKVRSAVEEYLALPKSAGGEGIPLVLIVIGGEFDTFERAANALEKDIPIVICKGCGGAGDILARAVNYALVSNNRLMGRHAAEIKILMEKMLETPKLDGMLFPDEPFEASKHLHFVKKCLDNHKMIHVFDLEEHGLDNLDAILIKALLNSKTAKYRDPIDLAMSWNRCDSVIHKILSGEIEDVSNDIHNLLHIERYMTKAIIDDKLEFIQLFLEFGYEMMHFLTKRKLGELYQYTMHKYLPFRSLMFKHIKWNRKKCYYVGDVYKICYNLTGAHLGKFEDSPRKPYTEPFRELAIWATLTNRWKLSYYFWTNSKEPIILALLLSQLWKENASVLSADEMDEEDSMLAHSKEMLGYAVDILKACWDTNKELSQELIQFQYREFGYRNQMNVASLIEAKEFIAHDCFQVTIDYLWKGGLRNQLLRTFICLFLPFMINSLKLNQPILNDDDLVDWVIQHPIDMDHQGTSFKYTRSASTVLRNQQKDLEKVKHTFTSKVIHFYSAPLTKFCAHLCAYLLFLTLFTQFYLYHLIENKYSKLELLVCLFMLCYALEEVRQILVTDASFSMKFRFWAQSEWNIIDFLYLSMFFIAFFLSPLSNKSRIPFTNADFPCFGLAKVLYGVVCMLLWIRLLRFYQCSPRLGQIWIMIRKMLIETLVFMTILGIVVIAAGFSMRVFIIEYIDEKDFEPPDKGFQWIFLRPFFTFNGELFLDNVTDMHPDYAVTLYYALILIFLFFGNALLLNLLIAIYGSIYSEVSQHAEIEWKSEMLSLMREYQAKTFFPPPINIFENLFLLFKYYSSCRNKTYDENVKKSEQMKVFETYCLKRILNEKKNSTTVYKSIDQFLVDVQVRKNKINISKVKINSFCKIIEEEKRAALEKLKNSNS